LNLSQFLNKKDEFQDKNDVLLKTPSEKSVNLKEESPKKEENVDKKFDFHVEKPLKSNEKNDQFEFMINEETEDFGSGLVRK